MDGFRKRCLLKHKADSFAVCMICEPAPPFARRQVKVFAVQRTGMGLAKKDTGSG
jgi:hypothetical protein|tara:strand:- start:1725 stop:1889 length:165 start_codon:yes stop_codon:yes gene_type:complete